MKAEYPRKCPVCGVAMVGERSRPDVADYDIHRCFNCGTVVDLRPATLAREADA